MLSNETAGNRRHGTPALSGQPPFVSKSYAFRVKTLKESPETSDPLRDITPRRRDTQGITAFSHNKAFHIVLKNRNVVSACCNRPFPDRSSGQNFAHYLNDSAFSKAINSIK
jgi:hypothetical protein